MFWLSTQCHGILDFKVFLHFSNFFLGSLYLVNITYIIFISYFQNKKMKQTVQVLSRSPLRRLILVVSRLSRFTVSRLSRITVITVYHSEWQGLSYHTPSELMALPIDLLWSQISLANIFSLYNRTVRGHFPACLRQIWNEMGILWICKKCVESELGVF